jgi:hypothetical protein
MTRCACEAACRSKLIGLNDILDFMLVSYSQGLESGYLTGGLEFNSFLCSGTGL